MLTSQGCGKAENVEIDTARNQLFVEVMSYAFSQSGTCHTYHCPVSLVFNCVIEGLLVELLVKQWHHAIRRQLYWGGQYVVIGLQMSWPNLQIGLPSIPTAPSLLTTSSRQSTSRGPWSGISIEISSSSATQHPSPSLSKTRDTAVSKIHGCQSINIFLQILVR
jgi:hypothetical protein